MEEKSMSMAVTWPVQQSRTPYSTWTTAPVITTVKLKTVLAYCTLSQLTISGYRHQ